MKWSSLIKKSLQNRLTAVLNKLVDYIDPAGKEKTLIFAATDQHADLVVRLLKEAFKERGDDIEDDAIMKITGYIYKPLDAITV